MSGEDSCYHSAETLISLFKSRDLSPVEHLQALIDRAETVNPHINAFADTYYEEALAAARLAEARYGGKDGGPRPLEGIPVAVKDAQRVAGKRTTQGSLVFKDHMDDRSDPMIERLTDAGAIIHARTTTPEFCLAGTCNSRIWGKTRNPFNLEYGPGGSSGGSAAALAAGTTTLATGTDIGGSIRIPASCCGVVGFKPPHGRNPDGPPANFDRYNHCGPLTRTVGDAALVQNVVSGPHALDHDSLRETVHIPATFASVRGTRVAWSMDFDYIPIDDEVRANTMAALATLERLGCTLEEVTLDWSEACDEAAIAWYGSMQFGRQTIRHVAEHRDLVTRDAIAMAEAAERTTLDEMAASWEMQHAMYQTFGPILERCDTFICPTTSAPAVRVDHDPLDEDFRVNGTVVNPEYGWILTHPFNMLHYCPVLAVPSGRSDSGIPTGIQIVGRTFDDPSVFRFGAALEDAAGGWFADDASRPAL